MGTEFALTSSTVPASEPRPRPGRRRAVVHSLLGLVAAVAILAGCLSPEQTVALDRLNRDRQANSREALDPHGDIQAKAQAWAERLARENRLFHSTLAAGAPDCWEALGENVGHGASVGATQAAFMASSRHRSNILNREWDFVGVGVAQRGDRTFVVQVFMRGC